MYRILSGSLPEISDNIISGLGCQQSLILLKSSQHPRSIQEAIEIFGSTGDVVKNLIEKNGHSMKAMLLSLQTVW